MSLDGIKLSIEAGAKSEAESIHSSAMSETKKILDEAYQKARDVERDFEKETADEIAHMRQEQNSEIVRATQLCRLEAADAYVMRESKDIVNGLASRIIKSDLYAKLFKDALKRALEIAPVNELLVKVNKRDERFVRNSGAHVEFANIDGLMISTRDGSIKIDATVDKLVDASIEYVRKAVISEVREGKRTPNAESVQVPVKRAAKRVAKSAKKSSKRATSKKAR